MDALVIVPFLIFLVVIFTAIAERINVPYPLLLVVVGLVVGFIPHMPKWHPPSHIVLPLFLPPILFAAARLVSWQDIKNNGLEIILLSFVLVITSAIGMAWSLNALFPILSIGSTFILGAVLSPTDAISATSILNKLNTKQRLVRSLEIESLFNDAVSISLYNLAVFLAFTGTINTSSLPYAIIPAAIGGILIGFILSYFTGLMTRHFLKDSENELPIIMGLVLAYIAYFLADHVGASGILSVVSAGLFYTKTERSLRARTRLAEQASWNTYIFFLNGVIFIIIGLQFPIYLQRVVAIPNFDLIAFSTITIALLLAFRVFWISFVALLSRFLTKYRLNSGSSVKYTWRDVIISSCSGMRGLVSLALAIALPTELVSGVNFPDRDLITFLTIIVIIFTVVIQGIALPFIVKALKLEHSTEAIQEESARIYKLITKKAIKHIRGLSTPKKISANLAMKLIHNYYAARLMQFNLAGESNEDPLKIDKEATLLLSEFLQYEREQLHDLLQHDKISQEVYIQIMRKIDRDEVSFSALG